MAIKNNYKHMKNNMKKIAICLMATCFLLTFQPLQSNAANKAPSEVVSKPADEAKAKALLLRLDEINAMDKSDLKSPEKSILRKEVRSIKNQLNELGGGGVYISVGAIIIILLLLIILL